jgi:hypothetical protein
MKKCLAVLFVLGIVTGCSDATGPKNDADSAVRTEASFCNAWAKAACNEEVLTACVSKDRETCIADQQSHCEDLVPSGYAPGQAEDCIAAVKKAYADAVLSVEELDVVANLGGDCGHLVAGAHAKGTACAKSTDCDTVHNYTCVIKAGDMTGTCQIPTIVGAGEPCDAPAEVCDTGLYCKGSTDEGFNCATRRKEDESCSSNNECNLADLCVGATDTDKGTCSAKAKKSEPCTTSDDCATGICLTTLQTPVCVDNIVLTAGSPYCVDLGGVGP